MYCILNLDYFSFTGFKYFMLDCYKNKFFYNTKYNLYIFSINNELIDGPIPYTIFNFNKDQIIKQLYTQILLKAKEHNITVVIVYISKFEK
jgi:hypothetical protein